MAGETYIKGHAVLLSIYDTTGTPAYEPIACLTSNTLSETVNVDEVVTKCDPGNAVQSAGTYSYELTGEGIYIDTAVDTDRQSHLALATLMRAKTLITWKLATGITVTTAEYGTGYITSLELTGDAETNATFSFTISGVGAITSTDPNA